MRPNGRTLYKAVMKGRETNLWGRRSYLTVRLPSSIFPVACPPLDYCKGWGKEAFRGHWSLEKEDGTTVDHSISKVSSGSHPESFLSEEELACIHDLTMEADVDYESFHWWEGERITLQQGADGSMGWKSEPLPAEVVDAHRAVVAWGEAYLEGEKSVDRGPVLQAFLDASYHAKTHYSSFSADGKFVYFTYSVKFFYRDRTKSFCSDLKKAFRIAQKHGIDAKLLVGRFSSDQASRREVRSWVVA